MLANNATSEKLRKKKSLESTSVSLAEKKKWTVLTKKNILGNFWKLKTNSVNLTWLLVWFHMHKILQFFDLKTLKKTGKF